MKWITMAADNDNDELEINPFYKALQEEFLSIFERAQQECLWICVPQSDSINPRHINRSFSETHVLRPSALFTGHFDSISTSKVKKLQLSDDGRYFIVDIYRGKGHEEKVKIVSEELAYNKELKPFKILVIEKPLHPSFETQLKEKDTKTKYLYTPKLSSKECSDFLKSFVDGKQNMEKLNTTMEYFGRHYMVLEDYLDDAAQRIGDICHQAFKTIMKTLKRPLNQDTKLHGVLSGAIESYVMNGLYSKIFPIVRQRMANENKALVSKCNKLNKVKPEQIGVPTEFACPLPSAVVELANLGSFQTPREKLVCLKATVDSATDGVTAFIRESQLGRITGEPEPCITSDDLIPILVMVIAQAKCCHLPTDLFYIENFLFETADRDRDNFSFCLVTFKAAVQYMISTDFSHLKDMKSSHEKEISIEELMKATNRDSGQPKDGHASPFSITSSPRADRLDRQLSRISNLLEKTSVEATKQQQERNKVRSIFPDRVLMDPAPDLIPEQDKRNEEKNSNSLGDFLTSLQDDDFSQAFGKQS